MTTLNAITDRRSDPERLLRTTLTVNAEVSAVWGAVVVLGAGVLAEPLGVPASWSVAVGAVAVVAALLFWRFRSRETLRVAEGWIATIGDVLFGGGLVVAALVAPDLTTLGRWLVGVSGLFVLDLGLVELVGVRRLAHRR